jgi:hypothetical protein
MLFRAMEESKLEELKRLLRLVEDRLKRVEFLSGFRTLEMREGSGFMNNLMLTETSQELSMDHVKLLTFVNDLEGFISDPDNYDVVKDNRRSIQRLRSRINAFSM